MSTESIKYTEINTEYKQLDYENSKSLIEFIDKYINDTRGNVSALVDKATKKHEKLLAEISRTETMYSFEDKYRGLGNEFICGIDEVGRGPLAGPVVATAIILPKNERILYLNDSKQLSKKKREELYDIILDKAIACGIGVVSEQIIDEINILQATYKAMQIAINNLKVKPDILLNDAVKIPDIDIRQVPIIKGDTLSASIAAASIVAKVTRDRMMEEYDKIYPGYDFGKSSGYGTANHIKKLKEDGPCEIHRKSFLKKILNQE
ncbi:MAG: ribonuclease HII [Lachnospiraceae bacterium]|nr:ribonuclease HII [Lachnospiraceae bacterium]